MRLAEWGGVKGCRYQPLQDCAPSVKVSLGSQPVLLLSNSKLLLLVVVKSKRGVCHVVRQSENVEKRARGHLG